MRNGVMKIPKSPEHNLNVHITVHESHFSFIGNVKQELIFSYYRWFRKGQLIVTFRGRDQLLRLGLFW